MARLPRIDVPGFAHHVVQRGVNRARCFVDNEDRRFYLATLLQAVALHECPVHAYVLMDNHVHLLVTPAKSGALSKTMHHLGTRFVRRFNARHDRTGTLWEGRFKSHLVGTERYLLACCRYIELNPVRAGIVDHPRQYRWSSVHANAYGERDPLVTTHPAVRALGGELGAYRSLLSTQFASSELEQIRQHLTQGKPWGSQDFRAHIEQAVGRPVALRPAGRPCKVR